MEGAALGGGKRHWGAVCEARFCFADVNLGAEGWLKLVESMRALTTLRSLTLRRTTFPFSFSAPWTAGNAEALCALAI